MAAIIAIASALMLFVGDAIYIRATVKGNAYPMKSTWLIWIIVIGLNVFSFLQTKFDLVSGLYGIVDFLLCAVIFAIVLVKSKQKFYFKKFEKYYLLLAMSCVIFWIASSNSFLTNIIAQILILIGYIPTIHGMIASKKSEESAISWLIWVFGSGLAIIPAFMNDNMLAIIYSIRGSIMCLIIFLLTLKYGINKRK
ncbi:MAG: hypothetical protein V1928_01540 [Parcubacteria group bacterium]